MRICWREYVRYRLISQKAQKFAFLIRIQADSHIGGLKSALITTSINQPAAHCYLSTYCSFNLGAIVLWFTQVLQPSPKTTVTDNPLGIISYTDLNFLQYGNQASNTAVFKLCDCISLSVFTHLSKGTMFSSFISFQFLVHSKAWIHVYLICDWLN